MARSVTVPARCETATHQRQSARRRALQALMADDSVPADWLDVRVTAGW